MRYYAFLRAINVGARRMTNDELLAPFRSAGVDDAQAYQAAGNVTFMSHEAPDVVAGRLSAGIPAAYGFDSAVFVRTADELLAVVDGCPFGEDQLATTEGRVQVSFLHRRPPRATVDAVGELVPDDDSVVFATTPEWWWLPRAGVSTSALKVGAVEALVGPMTMRTLATLERMHAKFDATP